VRRRLQSGTDTLGSREMLAEGQLVARGDGSSSRTEGLGDR
jgi:hypothetical protein